MTKFQADLLEMLIVMSCQTCKGNKTGFVRLQLGHIILIAVFHLRRSTVWIISLYLYSAYQVYVTIDTDIY